MRANVSVNDQRTFENRLDASAESLRLAESTARQKNWQRWGPYLAERQWVTVREDYSANGDV